jgi:hypothetical protein
MRKLSFAALFAALPAAATGLFLATNPKTPPIPAEPPAESVPADIPATALRQPPPTGGNPSAYQLTNRRFLISCTLSAGGPYSGAFVTGAASGPLDVSPAGNAAGVFQVLQPGPAAIIPATASGTGAPIAVNCTNVAPAISIGAAFGPLRTVTYSGVVTDDTPDSRVGLTVQLSGPPGGTGGLWALVRPDGTWSISTTLGAGVPATPVVATVTDWYAVSGSATLP